MSSMVKEEVDMSVPAKGRHPSLPEIAAPRRSVAEVLQRLERLATGSPNLLIDHGCRFQSGDRTYELPRCLYIGPSGGGDPLRVGIFAGMHGDEPEGVYASIRLLSLLEQRPDLATGYCLFIYPVCNPTGFEDRTRGSRGGKDLNREFWRGSKEPEVRLLESELASHSLHGIISLHTDSASHGFYGFAHGATLTQHLIKPALEAAEEFLPRNGDGKIDGFRARNGIIRDGYQGILSAPPGVGPRPFEIILETPQTPPTYLKEAAMVAALRAVLTSYREFIAYAPNL
jgi:hypothetical protein